MKGPIRKTLCILFALVLSATLLPIDSADARGGGGGGRGGGGGGGSRGGGGGGGSRGGGGGGGYQGGGSRGGGGGYQGGGASPRVNSNVNLQNGGNFKSPSGGSRPQQVDRSQVQNRPQQSVDRSQVQQNRQPNQQQRQGDRQVNQQERQGDRTQRQDTRDSNQQQRQGDRQSNQQNRQDQYTQRQDNRQNQRTDRQENRQDFIDDNYYGGWRGGGWYGGGYYVPPGWGWVGFTTGLIIGSAVAQPPPYYDTIYVGSTTYIYSDGIYMQPSGSQYTVVAPPVDAIVKYLPDGCTSSQTAGGTYYNCSGIYYQPFFQDGTTVYKVVQL